MSKSSKRNARKAPADSRITAGDHMAAMRILNLDDGFYQRRGRCFELAAKYVIHGDDPDAVVVHGSVSKGFGVSPDSPPIPCRYALPFPVPHAWVIRGDGTVHDPVWLKDWSSSFFHDQETGAVQRLTYSGPEANRNSLASRHWGPWDDEYRGSFPHKAVAS